LLDRFLPKIDQTNIDKRVADYIGKLLNGFEQALKRNTDQWKAVFKAIDDASKGEDTKWFRTLVAAIDSNAFASAADAETTKTIKKLGDSSKLLISNIQKISRGITKRQENIRTRVKNAIQHIPKVSSSSFFSLNIYLCF
jgi:GTP-binding protein EngB required for normal cell division